MMGQDHEVGSDQTQIIKGKRTKRHRSSSSTFLVAAATTITSTSSSAGGGSGERSASASDEYNSVLSSPVTTTDCTEEEEDMAICLIMLARGAAPSDLKNSRKTEKNLHQTENSSYYVYECKTCNRTFPSFQALGGHRASHKKPRASIEEKAKLPLMQLKSSASEEGQNGHFKVSGPALASKASNIIISKANKVHECSICGSEFTSGQALGGHMRRHRTATTVVNTAEVSRNSREEETENLSRSMEQRNYLPLDLNLPAPEDDLRESKFQGIVFSAATPALIDCHY